MDKPYYGPAKKIRNLTKLSHLMIPYSTSMSALLSHLSGKYWDAKLAECSSIQYQIRLTKMWLNMAEEILEVLWGLFLDIWERDNLSKQAWAQLSQAQLSLS